MFVLFMTLGYGLFNFTDAPISECLKSDTGYCGKAGQPHTLEEYNSYKKWEVFLFVIWPVGLTLLFLINKKLKKQ